MDDVAKAAKKHALRLVPYGLYLAGSRHADGHKSVSLVSWFTQTSFDPPLVVLGMHRESEAFKGVQETGVLSLNILGSTQKDVVKAFFKHAVVADGKAGPLAVRDGSETQCPILPDLPASLELRRESVQELGDHATVVFRVAGAQVHHPEMKALDHPTAGLHYAG